MFEDVFELADVAAIVVRHQYGERIGRYGIDIFIERFVEFRNKMLDEQWYVFFSFAQRG